MSSYVPYTRNNAKKKLLQFGSHIIYAEGIKTEPLYIESVKKTISARYEMKASDIIIVDDKKDGLDPMNLIKYAEKDIKSKVKKKQTIDHVWIFYDKDSFETDDFDNAYHKIISKNKKKFLNFEGDTCDADNIRWHSCWSNECFEFWVLLHFMYADASLSRKQYIPKINSFLQKIDKNFKYEKNLTNLYQILELNGDVLNAVKFAKRLDDNLSNPNKKENPSTGIYQFIEYFKLYLQL